MKPRQISGQTYSRRSRGRTASGGVVGPSIQLSNATIADTADINDIVGVLSVANGEGDYTFTLTSNPETLFKISGSSLEVAAALSAGSDAITVHADNGAGSTIDRAFIITVTHMSASRVPTFEFLGF